MPVKIDWEATLVTVMKYRQESRRREGGSQWGSKDDDLRRRGAASPVPVTILYRYRAFGGGSTVVIPFLFRPSSWSSVISSKLVLLCLLATSLSSPTFPQFSGVRLI